MKIQLHIERLILDGLPATSRQGPQIREAIQEELTQLLQAHGLSNELRQGVSVPRIGAGTLTVGPESQPGKLGTGIARALHEGLGNERESRAGKARFPSRGGSQNDQV